MSTTTEQLGKILNKIEAEEEKEGPPPHPA
jgi:hypothetical protein